MVESVEFIKETNTFLVHDYNLETFFNFKSELHGIDSFDTQFLDDINIIILKLNNSSTDFIIQYVSSKLASCIGFKSEDFMAKEYGKVLPMLSNEMIPILKKTYLSKSSISVNFHFFKDNSINKTFKLNIIYKKEYLAVYVENSEDKIILDKYNGLRSSVENYGNMLKLGKHFLKNGKYNWSDGIYKIIEREAKPKDVYNNIILELTSDKTRNDLLKKIDNLEPNGVLEKQKIKITTYNGNQKYLLVTIQNIDGYCQNAYYTDVTEKIMREEINQLNETINDVEKSNKFTVYYMNNDGSYHWTPGIYDIIERNPLHDDKYNHIILNLVDSSVKDEILNIFYNLEANTLSDNHEIKITTYKGNIKYLLFNFKKIFDDNNNFLQANCYIRDITDEVLREHELERVYDTLNDVEKSNKFTIYYRNYDGSYYWTPGIYDIIERDPLPEDKYVHILLDLANLGVKEEFFNVFDKLEPNELSDNFKFKITTVKGNTKYLLFNFKKVFDNEGNFIRGSTYVKDITDEYHTKREITILNKLISEVNKQLGTGTFVYDYENNNLALTDETIKILNINQKDSKSQLKEINSNFINQEVHGEKFKKLLNGEIKEINGILEYKSPERDYIQNLKIMKMFFTIEEKPVLIGGIIDVTSEIKRQEELKRLNKEMDLLIRESNHRIKNNLNLLLRFISLESRFNKNNPEKTIENTIGRIKSLSLFHEKLYKSDNLKILELNTYLKTFIEDIYNIYSDTYPGIKMICEDFYDFKIEKNNIIPLSLILNELIINSLKYAYNDYDIEDKKISINVRKVDDNLELHYMDNGKGLPKEFDSEKSTGLGWTIIRLLVGQIDGEYKTYNDNGMNFKVVIPYLKD